MEINHAGFRALGGLAKSETINLRQAGVAVGLAVFKSQGDLRNLIKAELSTRRIPAHGLRARVAGGGEQHEQADGRQLT